MRQNYLKSQWRAEIDRALGSQTPATPPGEVVICRLPKAVGASFGDLSGILDLGGYLGGYLQRILRGILGACWEDLGSPCNEGYGILGSNLRPLLAVPVMRITASWGQFWGHPFVETLVSLHKQCDQHMSYGQYFWQPPKDMDPIQRTLTGAIVSPFFDGTLCPSLI